MKISTSLLSALLGLALAGATSGCSTFSPKAAAVAKVPRSYALIVSVSGGGAPTDAQWATLQQRFSLLLAARGLQLVTDPTNAERLIQILFVPDLDDPTKGISYIVAVRDNPTTLLAAMSPVRNTGLSYATTPGFVSNGLQPQYYGYFDDYSNNNNYTSTPIVSVTPPAHPGNHHISRPVDCPPESPHQPGSTYAGGHPTRPNPPSDSGGGHWWNPRPSSEPSSSGYSSSSSYSSNSSNMGPSPSSSYSSSSSSQSLSFPSSSSSDYSSSSSSSFSSPSPSSSGSSGSGATTTNLKLN